jgi:hypothetical protein
LAARFNRGNRRPTNGATPFVAMWSERTRLMAQFYRRKPAGEFVKQHFGFGSGWLLARLAGDPDGPAFRLVGRVAIYAEEDLIAWAERRLESAPTGLEAKDAPRGRALAKARAEAKACKAEKGSAASTTIAAE